MKEKVIKKYYPQKGICIQLVEHYDRNRIINKRIWKLWIFYNDNRSLEIHGILTDKELALEFYTIVRKSLSQNKGASASGGKENV